MLKRLFLLALSVTVCLAIGYGADTHGKVTIPVNKTDATNGKQMFANYCAPCHGTDGRGHGPVAPALRTQPVDLTVLSRANNGKFPSAHISSVLQFGSEMPVHGTAQMPVWGPILGKMNQQNVQERALRISNLSAYLKSIQTK
jgi:mono/diheme cytochrome c family protein